MWYSKNVFLNKVWIPSDTYNSFIICKLWTSTKFVRLELSEKTLPLPKYEDIMLNSMTQTWEKWNDQVLSKPDFWMA